VRVTPRSARESIDGTVETAQGPALAMRVRAVAQEGEANKAVERVLAGWLGVAKSAVGVTSGAKSRVKSVTIAGPQAMLAATLEARMAALK
jgi:uncharacterized protein YggU (UPF0235/DUF167 family)